MVARLVAVGPVLAVAVGVSWAIVSLRASSDVREWASVIVFSTALALLGPGAALLADLNGWTRATRGGCIVVAIGAATAAIGNFGEDGLGVPAFGEVFAIGLGATLMGLLLLVVAFAVHRPRWPAAVALATLVGIFASQAAGGGFLVLSAWLVVAAALRRRAKVGTA